MNSTISFTVWKSIRKNAKVEMIDILHFEETTQERDIEKIVDATAKLINRMEKLGTKKIILSAWVNQNRQLDKTNCNDIKYNFSDVIGIKTAKNEFFSIEQAINFIWNCYMIAVPESTLSLPMLHESPSIRYYINQYYHH